MRGSQWHGFNLDGDKVYARVGMSRGTSVGVDVGSGVYGWGGHAGAS